MGKKLIANLNVYDGLARKLHNEYVKFEWRNSKQKRERTMIQEGVTFAGRGATGGGLLHFTLWLRTCL